MITLCPTASVRRLATCNVTGAIPNCPAVVTCTYTVRAGSQAKPAVGNVMLSCVAVAEVTVTGTPSTTTAFADAVAEKFEPVSA